MHACATWMGDMGEPGRSRPEVVRPGGEHAAPRRAPKPRAAPAPRSASARPVAPRRARTRTGTGWREGGGEWGRRRGRAQRA
eukprot:362754-Chlamydomonas_euryale.AAC.13